MGRKQRGTTPSASNLFKESTVVLMITNTVTFVLSLALIIVGAFINNEVKGWELRTFDIIGNLVLGLGVTIALVSVVGIMAGRTKARLLLFVYFMSILLVSYLLLLAVIWALVEGNKIDDWLDNHWEAVQHVLGTEVTREDAVELMQDYLYAVVGVGLLGLFTLLVALVSTCRLLGIRAIAYSCLVCLGVLGGGCIYAGVATRTRVPTATTWLLFGCGAVQVLSAVCGLAGFKNLNRECIRWFMIVLLAATGGLAYVVISTYTRLRDIKLEQPENLMLVFGIAIVSDFFMLVTGVAGAVFYCRQRGAFAAADRAAELPVHFSNNDRKYGKRGPGAGRKGRAREHSIGVRNAL